MSYYYNYTEILILIFSDKFAHTVARSGINSVGVTTIVHVLFAGCMFWDASLFYRECMKAA